MTTAKQMKTEQRENASHLRIVHGGKHRSRSTENLTAKAWLFAKASLWDNQSFSEAEVNKFRKLISEFFEETEFSEDALMEFIERVILAKRYVARSSYRYLAPPALWLNIHFKYGISGTESWYREVEVQRITAPEYNLGMSILAVAVVMYTNNPSPVIYRASRKKLIELKQFDLVPIFNSMVTAFHYMNK